MSRMLIGGLVLAAFSTVAVGHATVKKEGQLKDGRGYIVIAPGTGPCPEGFKRTYNELIPGAKKDDPATLGVMTGSWSGTCVEKPKPKA